jgi:hypothetical protein
MKTQPKQPAPKPKGVGGRPNDRQTPKPRKK